MTISTLVGQHLQGRTASNDLRTDVYKDQHGTSFGTCEHLRTYRLRPLETVVPEVCWKESIAQESLWTLHNSTSSDMESPIEASLESQYMIFVSDSELYFRINIYRSRPDGQLFATGETQDTYQLYTPHMDRSSAPVQARLWVSTPAESLIHDLRSDSADELIEVFKARVERQSLLPISRTLIREDQYLIRDLVGSDCQTHDFRINVYRDLASNEHSVATEERGTVMLSPEDYEDHTEDEGPAAIVSSIWLPNDTRRPLD